MLSWVEHEHIFLASGPGLRYIWNLQKIPNEAAFISEFVERLEDQYVQNWFQDMLVWTGSWHYIKILNRAFRMTYTWA